jgi:hypothetical protein
MSRLTSQGLSVDVPVGWDARIFRRPAEPGETTHTVLHAANFAVAPGVADYGDGAVDRMGPPNVFVALVEFHPSSTATPLFASRSFARPLAAADASRTTLQRAIGGQAGIQRFFTAAARAWCLYVVLGSYDGRVGLVDQVNQFLDTIEVSA